MLSIVQAMIKGGWQPGEETLRRTHAEKIGDYVIDVIHGVINVKICTSRILEELNRYGDIASRPIYTNLFKGSLPDLVMSPSAMKALCGEEIKTGWEHGSGRSGECYLMPAYIYHMMRCARILGEGGGSETVVEYLKDQLEIRIPANST